MIFLDINTFYCPRGGGIRTYHEAKLAWFREHLEHEYVLVYPGASRRQVVAEQDTANIRRFELFGPAVTKDPQGYRLLLDVLGLQRILKEVAPDIVETGEPWLSGPICLLLQKLGCSRAKVTSFYHGDPVRTYITPWAHRGALQSVRAPLARFAQKVIFGLQRQYYCTLTSTTAMQEYLRAHRVGNTRCTPFGAASLFFADSSERRQREQRGGRIKRLLYAGWLDGDKGMDVLVGTLPEILEQQNVEVTVAGRGAYAQRFADFSHPRFHFVGFVADRNLLRQMMLEHDLLLAPGPWETFGLVVLEAMANGLPVVGPNRGGTAEMLQKLSNPFLFRAGDPDSFLSVVHVALSSDLRASGEQHFQIASDYGNWSHAIGKMVELYEGLDR